MSEKQSLVPNENVSVFILLFQIEVCLRELIIKILSSKHGPRWWKHRLPQDVLRSYREGRDVERQLKWHPHIPHHPIYYIDFPDIKKIIERSDNWNECFQPVFGQKEHTIASLVRIEPIRNIIAHNRKVTIQDLRAVELVYEELNNILKPNEFANLVSKCSTAIDIRTTLSDLKLEAAHAFSQCSSFNPLSELKVWPMVTSSWWFDSDYLSSEISPIQTYFERINEYTLLPRERGTGHIIEAWIQSSALPLLFKNATQQMDHTIEETA